MGEANSSAFTLFPPRNHQILNNNGATFQSYFTNKKLPVDLLNNDKQLQTYQNFFYQQQQAQIQHLQQIQQQHQQKLNNNQQMQVQQQLHNQIKRIKSSNDEQVAKNNLNDLNSSNKSQINTKGNKILTK